MQLLTTSLELQITNPTEGERANWLQNSPSMGNCMGTCTVSKQEKGEECKGEEGGKREGGLKVKVLLTRGELDWLMAQLEEKGEKKLEDVLVEIGREREREGDQRAQVWKPSLESIMEIPESQGSDDVDQ